MVAPDSAKNAAIEVRDLVTKFGDKTVHQSVSFTIQRGTIVAIIGGSGSGKSVLLRQMLGLLRPTAGEIQVMGKSIWQIDETELSELRTQFGVLFQNGALFSALTVRENVGIAIKEKFHFNDAAVLNRIIDSRLVLAGLGLEHAEKMPSELSGGMVKRAALARALALEPKIIFLDEPGSGLDPVTARALDSLFRILCDSLQLTICMITHDLDSIRSIADKIVVLGEGKVLADGDYETVTRVNHPWIKEYFSTHGKGASMHSEPPHGAT